MVSSGTEKKILKVYTQYQVSKVVRIIWKSRYLIMSGGSNNFCKMFDPKWTCLEEMILFLKIEIVVGMGSQ